MSDTNDPVLDAWNRAIEAKQDEYAAAVAELDRLIAEKIRPTIERRERLMTALWDNLGDLPYPVATLLLNEWTGPDDSQNGCPSL